MIYKENYEMIEPKENFVERFWNITLPRYRRKKRMKLILSSVAGLFFIFALVIFLRSSFIKEDVYINDVWNDAYALIENEPNYYETDVVWISTEELEIYNQIKNENK